MSDDEEVDGPAIAAKLLSAMDPEKKDRLLKNIQQREPDLALKIEDSIFQFEDIPGLTKQSIEGIVSSTNHADLVLALRGASETTKKAVLKGMSEKKRTIVEDDLTSMAAQPKSQVQDAQKRILKTIEDLRSDGKIRSKLDKDIVV